MVVPQRNHPGNLRIDAVKGRAASLQSQTSTLHLADTRSSYINVGDGALIKYLVDNGADINMKNPVGYSTLSWAVNVNNDQTYRKIADVLRKLGAHE